MRTNYGGNFVEGRIFWFVFTLFTMSKFSDSSILRSFLHLSIWLFPKDHFEFYLNFEQKIDPNNFKF